MIYEYIVVGAGFSGLNFASLIQENNIGSVLILEKSRGVGGRVATRRTLDSKFDHGAQFYKLNNDILKLHKLWTNEDIVVPWFKKSNYDYWNAKDGMTNLAKLMAKNLEVKKEVLVGQINYEKNKWVLVTDKNEKFICNKLILSCPLPQSVKLIETITDFSPMSLEIFEKIKNIKYTKALVGLMILEQSISDITEGYLEFMGENIFSIADQHLKKVSNSPAITVTMSPDFSESYFDKNENEVSELIKKELNTKYPHAKIKEFELKKWRYCRPLQQYDSLYLEVAKDLFLIGDSFGGSSLLGAIRSSHALVEKLKEEK